jgi:predicted dehydrogenase
MRTAVIGLGAIARHHLMALRDLPGAELQAVCDLSRAAGEAAVERFGAGAWYTDHRAMLAAVRPEIVHVTTPPQSHYEIVADCLDAGAHVIVEKPAAVHLADVRDLVDRALRLNLLLVEDYNYLFNRPVAALLDLVAAAGPGAVLHVTVTLCLDVLAPGSAFSDPTYPSHRLPAGAIGDFLPHLASLAHAFVGPHRGVSAIWAKRRATGPLPADELRALVDGERGTALLSFSANTRPDALEIRVDSTDFRATASVFDSRLLVDRERRGPRALLGTVNGLALGAGAGRAAVSGFFEKVSGRGGSLEGLPDLVRRTHAAASSGAKPPVSLRQMEEVHRLVADVVAAGRPA